VWTVAISHKSQCSPEMRSTEDIDLLFDDESQCSRLMRKRKISTIHEKWILCCGMCKSCQIANRLIRIESKTVAEGITAY